MQENNSYNIVIVGLGLIGGSLAKTFKKIPKIKKIVGIDSHIDYCNAALKEGILDEGYKTLCQDAIKDADFVFICTPVDLVVPTIEVALPYLPPHCIITDVGSTKKHLVETIDSLFPSIDFIGGHPMAGSEKSGYFASSDTLFKNCHYILTPTSSKNEKQLNKLQEIILELEAIPVICSPEEHDFCTAGISHVPHAFSSIFATMIKELDHNCFMHKIASTGFKDFTRIASSNPNLWTHISLQNKENLLFFLEKYIFYLNEFKNHLTKEDVNSLYSFFDNAKNYRDSF